jgi:hypothetical protein
MCRINTAGQIPKEVVSLNHDIVRTGTFNPADLENILSRPVCLCLFLHHHLIVASTDPYVARLGPGPEKRHSSGSLARGTATLWPMFRCTPAHCKLYICPDRAFLCCFPMDTADIWRAARRSDVALQAQCVCPCTGTDAIACRLGIYAQCRVLGRVCCYISRCG